MKTIKTDIFGELPKDMQNLVEKYQNQKATKEVLYNLESDMEFFVCDLKTVQGNFNRNNTWFSPNGNDNTWNLQFNY